MWQEFRDKMIVKLAETQSQKETSKERWDEARRQRYRMLEVLQLVK